MKDCGREIGWGWLSIGTHAQQGSALRSEVMETPRGEPIGLGRNLHRIPIGSHIRV